MCKRGRFRRKLLGSGLDVAKKFLTGELGIENRGIYWRPSKDVKLHFRDVSRYFPEGQQWEIGGKIKF